MKSPYKGISPDKWKDTTLYLVKEHPLKPDEIVNIVLKSWDSIFASSMGSEGFKIGVQIFPKPQIMGFFLHELIPLELAARYHKLWRTEKSPSDKDIVYIPDEKYSIELKTSSNSYHIYGNRSYAKGTTSGKKAKSGYYLAVNFEKFSKEKNHPCVKLIRFGWIDASDWIGQKAATGQQSRLLPEVESLKFLELFSV